MKMAKFGLHIEYTVRNHTTTLQKNMGMPKFGLHIKYTGRTLQGRTDPLHNYRQPQESTKSRMYK
jgi:hypothetical protein